MMYSTIKEAPATTTTLQEFKNSGSLFIARLRAAVDVPQINWKFINTVIALLFVWIIVNIYLLSCLFNLYLFIPFNLLFGYIATCRPPFNRMNKHLKEKKDRRRALDEYVYKIKAEAAVGNLHAKIDLLMNRQQKSQAHKNRLQTAPPEEQVKLSHRAPGSHLQLNKLAPSNRLNI